MGKPNRTRDVIRLADLAPRHDVKGGSRQRVFGDYSSDETEQKGRHAMAGAPKVIVKDLPPKSTSKVKGGRLVD